MGSDHTGLLWATRGYQQAGDPARYLTQHPGPPLVYKHVHNISLKVPGQPVKMPCILVWNTDNMKTMTKKKISIAFNLFYF